MIKRIVLIVGFFFAVLSVTAQSNCSSPDGLIELDGQWEKALLESDVEFLESLLAEDFLWTHNHAASIDSKSDLLSGHKYIRDNGLKETLSREQFDVEAYVVGSAGVVVGYTIVDRGGTARRFRFLRAYSEMNGKCLLVANQTMMIPDEEN